MQPDAPRENSKQFFRSSLPSRVERKWFVFEKRFSKNPQCVLEKLSFLFHTPMPTPKGCKTFRFENDSLKKDRMLPDAPRENSKQFFRSSLPSRAERKWSVFVKRFSKNP